MIKTFLTAIIASTILTTSQTFTTAFNELDTTIYIKNAAVIVVDYDADIVTFEDAEGFLWDIYGCENWNTGDIAKLLFDNLGTHNIYDDVILFAKKEIKK